MARPTIEKIAKQIQSELGEEFAFGDGSLLQSLIAAIMQAFAGCGLSAKQVEARAANPRRLDQFRLRRMIREHTSVDEDAVFAALLDAGQDLTSADIKKLYAEAKDFQKVTDVPESLPESLPEPVAGST